MHALALAGDNYDAQLRAGLRSARMRADHAVGSQRGARPVQELRLCLDPATQGRGQPKRPVLEHLRIGDANGHLDGGFADRVAAQEPEFENCARPLGKAAQNCCCSRHAGLRV